MVALLSSCGVGDLGPFGSVQRIFVFVVVCVLGVSARNKGSL